MYIHYITLYYITPYVIFVFIGHCESDTNSEGHSNSRIFSCDGSTAKVTSYEGSRNCTGSHMNSEPITLNGACTMATCFGFDESEYNEGGCKGKPVQEHNNEYVLFDTTGCNYNKTSSCVNGEPQTKFYNNTMCSGDPVHISTAGQCETQGHHSRIVRAVDNPCGSN